MARRKLVKCPFCNGTRLRATAWGDGFGYRVVRFLGRVSCSCGASMTVEYTGHVESNREGEAEAKALAIEKWNDRAGSEGGRA